MKVLKFFVLALLVSLVATPAVAGSGLGLALHDFDDFGIQARTSFGIGKLSELTGGVDWYFDNNNWWAFDLDYHFIIKEGSSRFYPLAGLEIATSFDGWEEFGVNLGGGMDFNMSDTLAAYTEAKFVLGGRSGLHLVLGLKF